MKRPSARIAAYILAGILAVAACMITELYLRTSSPTPTPSPSPSAYVSCFSYRSRYPWRCPSPPPLQDNGTLVSGRITDLSSGLPIEGALVQFRSVETDPYQSYSYGPRTCTNVEGEFSIPVVAGERHMFSSLMDFVLVVNCPGFITEWAMEDVANDVPFAGRLLRQPEVNVEIELTPLSNPPLTITNGRFVVQYQRRSQEAIARLVMGIMQDYYAEVTITLGREPASPTTMFNIGQQWETAPLGQGFLGVQGGFDGLIITWNPFWEGPDGSLDNSFIRDVYSMIPHELVHHVLADVGKPLWFDEGVAQLVGTHMIAEGMELGDINESWYLETKGRTLVPFQHLYTGNHWQYDAAAVAIASIARRADGISYIERLVEQIEAFDLEHGRSPDDSEMIGLMSCVADIDLSSLFREWAFDFDVERAHSVCNLIQYR